MKWLKIIKQALATGIAGAGLLAISGCADEPTLFPNPDPELRLKSSQFAADAAARFPYKDKVPHAVETHCRAIVDYAINRLEIVNFSDEDWSDVEVWVNQKYVCHVPKMQSRQVKEIHFPMLYDETGKSYPMNDSGVFITKFEILRGGTMYEVAIHPND